MSNVHVSSLLPKNKFIASLSDYDLALVGQDILEWKHTGLLPENSKLAQLEKDLVKDLNLIDGTDSMRIAESFATDEMIRRFCQFMAPYEDESRLQSGQDIWYTDKNTTPEHGIIQSVFYTKDNSLGSFSVNFDNGDFDEFVGTAYLTSFFSTKEDAELRYRTLHTYNEF